MDISTGNSAHGINPLQSSGITSSNGARVKAISDKPANRPELVKDRAELINKENEELNIEEITQITDGLNNFMSVINTDLQFKIHEGTNRIMVQFVDTKARQVIKEFPPHELLDTLAAIRDYVGILLDKRA